MEQLQGELSPLFENSAVQTEEEGHKSKSKEMLKKYISEIAMLREGKGIPSSDKNFNNNQVKIAAPKPVRPRPLGFAHNP